MLERGNLFIHLADVLGKILRLLLEEGRRFLRLPLSTLQILAQEQAGQLVGDLLGQVGRVALVRHGERDGGLRRMLGALVHDVGADHFDRDVFGEPLHDFFGGVGSTQVRVEIVLFHDLPQGRPAHDLLLDRFDSLIGITGNRRMNEFGWNFLFLDQNGRHGFVGRRPEERGSEAEAQQNATSQDNQSPSPMKNSHIGLKTLDRFGFL